MEAPLRREHRREVASPARSCPRRAPSPSLRPPSKATPAHRWSCESPRSRWAAHPVPLRGVRVGPGLDKHEGQSRQPPASRDTHTRRPAATLLARGPTPPGASPRASCRQRHPVTSVTTAYRRYGTQRHFGLMDAVGAALALIWGCCPSCGPATTSTRRGPPVGLRPRRVLLCFVLVRLAY